MVKRSISLRLIPILALIPMLAFGQDRTVIEVTIEAVGLNGDPPERNSAEGCMAFKPTVPQVEHYFKHAFPVEGYMITTDRYSPCYATGSVTFSDNSSATWRLYSSGVASFFFNSNDHVYLYYKHNRWIDVTACTYGLGDEGDC